MSLRDDKQQNLQLELDFSSALTGAARGVAGEETESSVAASGTESPARTTRLMEEICERENLKEAWYQTGIRLLGRTAVECTRDALGDRIGLDVASVGARMPSKQWVVIDPFGGSCNTLFWILRHLPNSEGIAFESDLQVFDLTHRNLAILDHRIELVHGDYSARLQQRHVPEDRGIVAFVAPP